MEEEEGDEREGREGVGRARLGYSFRSPEFLVTPLLLAVMCV